MEGIKQETCSKCKGEGYLFGGKQGHVWYQMCTKCDGYGYQRLPDAEPSRIAKRFSARKRKERSTEEFLTSLRQGLVALATDIDRRLGG